MNCIAFGLIDTRLTLPADDPGAQFDVGGASVKAGIPAEALETMRAMVPLGRAGSAQEAAGSIYLLCIPESDYISGQVLLVTGGMA